MRTVAGTKNVKFEKKKSNPAESKAVAKEAEVCTLSADSEWGRFSVYVEMRGQKHYIFAITHDGKLYRFPDLPIYLPFELDGKGRVAIH